MLIIVMKSTKNNKSLISLVLHLDTITKLEGKKSMSSKKSHKAKTDLYQNSTLPLALEIPFKNVKYKRLHQINDYSHFLNVFLREAIAVSINKLLL